MSFQQGLSGLNAMSKNLDVIGNNVANANTYGAKSSRAEFADLYANAVNGAGRNFIGIGVQVATVAQQFTQGNITATENPMDVAINGGGFFQLTDSQNPVTYSRNGQFKLDSSGYVVNDQGLKLVGYPADANGLVQTGQPGPLRVPTAGVAPKATGTMAIELNLSTASPVTDAAKTTPPTIDFSNDATYNATAEMNVFDAKGSSIPVTFYYQRNATDPNQWDVYAKANGTSLAGTDAAPLPISTLTFDASGVLTSSPTMSLDIPATTPGNGSPDTSPITGITVASLIGGALLIEVTYSWPGIAFRLQEAIAQRDYPLVQGIVVVVAALVVLVSLVVDVLVALLDPRISF
jgi:flagellar hook protein FlgE